MDETADPDATAARPRRTLVRVVGLIVLVAIAAAGGLLAFGWFQGRSDESTRNLVDASARARAACDHLDRFDAMVRRNAPATDVLRELDAAITDAEAAARADATYVPLQSGAQTVKLALEKDDPGAVRIGLDVVRSNCARVPGAATYGDPAAD